MKEITDENFHEFERMLVVDGYRNVIVYIYGMQVKLIGLNLIIEKLTNENQRLKAARDFLMAKDK